MAFKFYGKIHLTGKGWKITELDPHVCIRLKHIFPSIPKHSTVPFTLPDTDEMSADLEWFTMRYPLQISKQDSDKLTKSAKRHHDLANEIEKYYLPDYVPKQIKLKEGKAARKYQLSVADIFEKTKSLLLGDEFGLGKSLTSLLPCLRGNKLPAIVVCQTHLQSQWENDVIKEFTNLSVHCIKKRTQYELPQADIYVIKYSCLSGWVDVFKTGYFKYVIFDECQELRRSQSDKYQAAKSLRGNVQYCMGLSATPIYNYGDEIWTVMNIINPGALGSYDDFMREWTNYGKVVKYPTELGSYLREKHLFIRRRRADVGMELPPVNKIIYNVGYDHEQVEKEEELLEQLAIRVVSGSFVERGEAARELDIRLRQITGVSKAREVATFVRMMVEAGEPVVLFGWHRDVYKIWMDMLADLSPVLYTGSESPAKKAESVQKFIAGESLIFIMSLRSGPGLDGLQKVCSTAVFGELDWSPKVHDQCIARVDRPGQADHNPVNAIFLVSEYGSDPEIIKLLAIKSSQSHQIVDPLLAVPDQQSDESRIKALAESILSKKHKKPSVN